jgi:Fic family protein
VSLEGDLQRRLEAAILAVGRLDGVSTLLTDKSLILYSYMRKEAVLSSQIEGTQSTLSDLLLFELEEAPGVPLDDVVEVSNYVAALDHGIARLREPFPLSNRLIREIHAVLFSRGRGVSCRFVVRGIHAIPSTFPPRSGVRLPLCILGWEA